MVRLKPWVTNRATNNANETIFSEANAQNPIYYEIQATPDGTSLIYNNDVLSQPVTWAVPVSLLGRLAHVAVVFTNSTVTAYVDGLSLGTKANPSFGSSPGGGAWIGSAGGLSSPGEWTGSIDEVAIYSSALSANAIAIHNSKFLFGTNTTGPTIASVTGTSETLLAGGLTSFSVSASARRRLLPMDQQHGRYFGRDGTTLTLSPTTTNMSATYGVTVSNPYGSTNSSTFDWPLSRRPIPIPR